MGAELITGAAGKQVRFLMGGMEGLGVMGGMAGVVVAPAGSVRAVMVEGRSTSTQNQLTVILQLTRR